MHAKGELERVLLNVGTSLRVGGERAGPAAAPPLPTRRMGAGQISSSMAPPPAVTVTVTHSPVHPGALGASGKGGGAVMGSPVAAGGSRGRDPQGWRAHFTETMAAFDERHARLQAELSGLKREALQPVP